MKCTNDISDFLKDPQACGHNFCLKCFEKWIGMGKITCAKCRSSIPAKMAKQPRVNSTLVVANRMAKTSKLIVTGGSSKGCNFFNNHDQPDRPLPQCGQRGMERPMLQVARYLSPSLQIILDLFWVCWLERPGRVAMGCALSTSCRNCWTVKTWCTVS
ncbi:hypothetical protein Q3G72_018031 [Acer saccharum]|nr:hypothetical protein Q3G72_018031 [Acer saccharum]